MQGLAYGRRVFDDGSVDRCAAARSVVRPNDASSAPDDLRLGLCRDGYVRSEEGPGRRCTVPATIEGRIVAAAPKIAALLAPFLERVAAKRNEPTGITTAGDFKRNHPARGHTRRSAGGCIPRVGTPIRVHELGGGLRANLRPGPLVYSDIYEVSPFDNYPSIVSLSGAQVADVLRTTSTGGPGSCR